MVTVAAVPLVLPVTLPVIFPTKVPVTLPANVAFCALLRVSAVVFPAVPNVNESLE